MRLSLPPTLWPVLDDRRAVVADATALLRDFEAGAAAIAAHRSWREDLGLLASRRPGHWARVAREIAGRATPQVHTFGLDRVAGTAPAVRVT